MTNVDNKPCKICPLHGGEEAYWTPKKRMIVNK
jgi:hypothetical protein